MRDLKVDDPPGAYASTRKVSDTEAARTFSDLLNRVEYRGERFVIDRGGRSVAVISPAGPQRFRISDLAALMRSAPRPDPEYFRVLENAANDQRAVEDTAWER